MNRSTLVAFKLGTDVKTLDLGILFSSVWQNMRSEPLAFFILNSLENPKSRGMRYIQTRIFIVCIAHSLLDN